MLSDPIVVLTRSRLRLLSTLNSLGSFQSPLFRLRPVIPLYSSLPSVDIGSQPGVSNMVVASLPNLQDLRLYVLETLCNYDRLDPGQAVLHEGTIHRSGRSCGLFFQVSGPRLLKSHAVWAAEENRILFYNSNGQRFSETLLSVSPETGNLAA